MNRQTFDMDTATAPAPAAPAPDCSDADLYAAAAAADAGQPLPAASTASPAPEATPDTTAAPVETRKPESADDRAAREEAELAEQAAAADRAAQEQPGQQKPAQDQPPKPGEKPESAFEKARKDAERKEKTWKQLQAEKEAVRQEAERIQQERAEFTRLRQEHEELKKRLAAPAAPVKDEHGHTAEDYERLAKRYEREEDHEMAKLAMAKASALKAKAAPPAPAATQQPANDPTTPEFQAKWRETTAALVQAEPDLAKPDNPVVQAANALLQDKNWSGFFLARPDGIRAAVEVAKLQQTAARAATFEKELATAKAEIARLTKLVSPRGSLPASAAPGDRRPEDLSDADMLALAAQADQGG